MQFYSFYCIIHLNFDFVRFLNMALSFLKIILYRRADLCDLIPQFIMIICFWCWLRWKSVYIFEHITEIVSHQDSFSIARSVFQGEAFLRACESPDWSLVYVVTSFKDRFNPFHCISHPCELSLWITSLNTELRPPFWELSWRWHAFSVFTR